MADDAAKEAEEVRDRGLHRLQRLDLKGAEPLFARALALFRECGNRAKEAAVLDDIGSLRWYQGRKSDAAKSWEAALSLAREVKDHKIAAVALGNLALLRREENRRDIAEEYYREALTVHRDLSDRRNEAVVLLNLGSLVNEMHRATEAESLLTESIERAIECNDIATRGKAEGALACIVHGFGRLDDAERLYRAALRTACDPRNRNIPSEGVIRGNLGNLLLDRGNLDGAAEQYQLSLAIHRRCKDDRSFAIVISARAQLLHERRDDSGSESGYEEAIRLSRRLNEPWREAIAEAGLALLRYEQRRWEEALALFERALPELREAKDLQTLGRTLAAVGAARSDLGDEAGADAAFAEAETALSSITGDRDQWMRPIEDAAGLAMLGAARCHVETLRSVRAASRGDLAAETEHIRVAALHRFVAIVSPSIAVEIRLWLRVFGVAVG